MVEIKTKCCGVVICSGGTATGAVIQGYLDGVSFKGADFGEVDFSLIPASVAFNVLVDASTV